MSTTAPSGLPASRPSRIEERTPAELQEIAARYHLKITGEAGNTPERLFVFAICMGIILGGLALVASFIDAPVWVRLLVMLGLWMSVGGGIAKSFFLVEVAQLVAVKAQNRFGGRVHVFMPGWNIRYPWEEVTPNDHLTLRSGVTSRPISAPTKDGLVPTFNNPMFRWRVFPPLLLLNASHEEETIDKAATDIFESVVRDDVKNVTMDKLPAALGKIQEHVRNAMEDPSPKHEDVHGSTYEEQYGLTAEIVALGAPTYPQDYKEAREGDVTMGIYHNRVLKMVEASRPAPGEAPTMSYAQALDTVMMNAKEAIKKNIDVFRIEMDENARDASHNFGEALRAGGPAVAAAAEAFANRRGKKKGTTKSPGGRP